MADDARSTCERCRRPKSDNAVERWEPDYCWWPHLRAECDRLLLAERDTLAEAGDALAERLTIWAPTGDPANSVFAVLARWRALRSPKGASNGE